jgi:hypothetical protein
MKKIVLLLMTLIPALIFSQNLRFSIVGDPQISWMVPDKGGISREGSVIGLNAGMGMDIFFAENYAFSTGLTISNLGGKLSYTDPIVYHAKTIPAHSTIIYKLQYLSVPLGLKFKTNEIGYATYFANLGLNPMINIRARASDSEGITDLDNISENINRFNINYFITLGVQYSLGGSFALIGGLGYSSGFADVTSTANDKICINTLTIRIGVLF